MKKSGIGKTPVYQAFNPDSLSKKGLSSQEVQTIKEAFDLLDSQKTGQIESNELRELIKAFNYGKQNISMELAVEEITKNKKRIDFPSFLEAFTAFAHSGLDPNNLSRVFRLFDDEKMGVISVKNLRRVAEQVGLQINDSQLQEMVDRADRRNSGALSEQDFKSMMSSKSRH